MAPVALISILGVGAQNENYIRNYYRERDATVYAEENPQGSLGKKNFVSFENMHKQAIGYLVLLG